MANNAVFVAYYLVLRRWLFVISRRYPSCLVLCFSLLAVRRLDFGGAGGASDGDLTVPGPRRRERVSDEHPVPYDIISVMCSCFHQLQRH